MDILTLAFIGDAVWSVLAREWAAKNFELKIGGLNKKVNEIVSARAQAKIYERIKNIFTEKEQDIARRARNTRKGTISKNVGLAEYAKSTSLEAVIGYNHMLERHERNLKLFEEAVKE